MLGFITNWALKKANKIMDSRPPDFVIGPKEDPYMLRWWAIPRNKYFNIYLHKILHDDDDRALHDHPWPSLSLMTSGGLFETYINSNDVHKRRWISIGEWIYRNPNFAHRLQLAQYGDKPAQPATTIFMTGPRIREWGFHCPKGWRHWKDFVNQENKGEQGVGCGEIPELDENGILNNLHCRQCGGEIYQHYYDGYCRNCVESSPYLLDPIDWEVFTAWLIGILFLIMIWIAILYWWFL